MPANISDIATIGLIILLVLSSIWFILVFIIFFTPIKLSQRMLFIFNWVFKYYYLFFNIVLYSSLIIVVLIFLEIRMT